MRYAIRALLRTPGFTAIAVLTLAIGIGTTTTIFAVVDELVFQRARSGDGPDVYVTSPLEIPDYETLSSAPPDGVAAIAAYERGLSGLLQMPGRAEFLATWQVTAGYAEVHRVRAQAGRWINDADNAGGVLDPSRTILGTPYPYVLGTMGSDVLVIS